MPWTSTEATVTPILERRTRAGRVSEEVDLFGVAPELAGAGISAAGRPRLQIRLMVGLLYLKHAYNESAESVCGHWAREVYFQFFCGETISSRACLAIRPIWCAFGRRWAKPVSRR
jgi:IS5 family transposase